MLFRSLRDGHSQKRSPVVGYIRRITIRATYGLQMQTLLMLHLGSMIFHAVYAH